MVVGHRLKLRDQVKGNKTNSETVFKVEEHLDAAMDYLKAMMSGDARIKGDDQRDEVLSDTGELVRAALKDLDLRFLRHDREMGKQFRRWEARSNTKSSPLASFNELWEEFPDVRKFHDIH